MIIAVSVHKLVEACLYHDYYSILPFLKVENVAMLIHLVCVPQP